MQKRNVVDVRAELTEQETTVSRGALREECLFGSLADIRACVDYYKQKTQLSIIDKRLLLGVFQREVEVQEEDSTSVAPTECQSPGEVLSLRKLARKHRSRHFEQSPKKEGFSLHVTPMESPTPKTSI